MEVQRFPVGDPQRAARALEERRGYLRSLLVIEAFMRAGFALDLVTGETSAVKPDPQADEHALHRAALLLTAPETSTDERHKAARLLAPHVSGPLADPRALQPFRDRLEEEQAHAGRSGTKPPSRRALLENLLIEALLTVAASVEARTGPQKIQVGRPKRCVTWADDGSPAELPPDWIPLPNLGVYTRWLLKEARNALEAGLLDQPYPGPGEEDALDQDVLDVDVDALPGGLGSPAAGLVAVQSGWRRYRRGLEAAQPADRRLYVAVRRELARNPGLTLGDAYRTVAGRFGLSEVRVRSARSRVAAAARTA